MKEDLTLVIMAAGMGSRFGGLKQIEPVGPNGEFIIDYSIYDAIRSGFNKVIFVIKKSFAEAFKETIGKRIEGKIKVEYVYQETYEIPDGINVPSERQKPFGTGHALYVAGKNINESFAVISADDFYGHQAFEDLGKGLKNSDNYIIIGYEVGTTLTENGAVKRGIIFEEDGYLKKMVESKVEKKDGIINVTPLDGSREYIVEDNHPVGMLMYGLRLDSIDFVNKDIVNFFHKADLLKDEYYLPDILNGIMESGKKLSVIKTKSIWKGMTYKTDLDDLKEYINEQIQKGIYPNNLWK